MKIVIFMSYALTFSIASLLITYSRSSPRWSKYSHVAPFFPLIPKFWLVVHYYYNIPDRTNADQPEKGKI